MGFPNFLKRIWEKVDDLYARVSRRLEVDDTDFLYRRIHPSQIEDGEFSSAAFGDPQMSADIASLTTVEKSYARCRSDKFGLVKVPVGGVRTLKIPQDVKHWPTVFNWSHGLAIGKKTNSIKKRIKEQAEWVVKPSSSAEDESESVG